MGPAAFKATTGISAAGGRTFHCYYLLTRWNIVIVDDRRAPRLTRIGLSAPTQRPGANRTRPRGLPSGISGPPARGLRSLGKPRTHHDKKFVKPFRPVAATRNRNPAGIRRETGPRISRSRRLAVRVGLRPGARGGLPAGCVVG